VEDKYGYESRKYTEGICMFKMGFQQRPNLCKDSIGNLVAGEQQALNVRDEYLKGLLNKGGEGEDQVNTVYFGTDPFVPALLSP
jgi:hypothetical protein